MKASTLGLDRILRTVSDFLTDKMVPFPMVTLNLFLMYEGSMKISIIAFDEFTDIDVWLMWDLLKRVKNRGWQIKILGEKDSVVSQTGIIIPTHGNLNEANTSDVVLFTSGPGTRKKIQDQTFLSSFDLRPEKQLIGSMCSGSLILAALGVLKPGDRATTYPTAVKLLKEYQIQVVEESLVVNGNVATAAGCLAAQSLVKWVIERLVNKNLSEIVINSIQPVGQGLSFNEGEWDALYSTPAP